MDGGVHGGGAEEPQDPLQKEGGERSVSVHGVSYCFPPTPCFSAAFSSKAVHLENVFEHLERGESAS